LTEITGFLYPAYALPF